MSNRSAGILPGGCEAPAARARRPRWLRGLAAAACVVAGALGLALAVRPIDAVDLGYHLAYGQRTLDTGRIVSDDSFIHPPVTPAGVAEKDMPPGAHFDAQGRYHFPNANWLTQVVLAALWRLGGWGAMNATLIVLVGVIMAFQAATLMRLGAWPLWLAGVWLTTGVIAQDRYLLRPELFAFACLAVQLWLLAGPVGDPQRDLSRCEPLTWPRIAAFIVVQVLAVNVHSYWLLGVALIGAFWADAALRAGWTWLLARTPLADDTRRRLIRLSVGLAAMLPAAMLHPEGPANAVFPFKTLSYLKQFDVAGMTRQQLAEQWQEGTMHPWATIGEFSRPFTRGQWAVRSTKVLAGVMAAAAAAMVVLLGRRRWGEALLLAGLTAGSLSMRRNIVILPILGGPLIAAALAGAWRARWRGEEVAPPLLLARVIVAVRPGGRWNVLLPAAGAVLALFAGAWWLMGVATNRFYDSERRLAYLGLGPSRLVLPLGVCQWLDERLPGEQPVFTDQPSSSSVVFFSEKVTGVPILTNTWATPSDRFRAIIELGAGTRGPELLDEWGLDVAVLRVWPSTAGLACRLAGSDQWVLAHAQTSCLVFVRRSAATPAMLAQEITEPTFDASAFIADCRRQHPVAALALKDGAVTFHHLGWFYAAEPLWRACLASPPGDRFHEAWLNLGTCLARTAVRQLAAGEPGGIERLREARGCFARALAIKADYEKAQRNLQQADGDLEKLARP